MAAIQVSSDFFIAYGMCVGQLEIFEICQGCVYLFGKMQIPEKPDTYISACCIVKNIPRVIFVLPRKYKYNKKTKESNVDHEIKTGDVVEEIDKVLEKYKIFNYRSKVVEKNYAFDSQHDVPYKCEYLQIEYSPEMPQLPQDIDGETFQCIFGTQTAFLETFLLNLKLKGK
jgi:DNA polymerase alpha subunit A